MNALIIMNHKLLPEQEKTLKDWGVEDIYYLPESLQDLIRNIPPEWDILQVQEKIVNPIYRHIFYLFKQKDIFKYA